MPRAMGNDIVEMFGYAPDEVDPPAREFWEQKLCPFSGKGCDKTGDAEGSTQPVVYGVCSVSHKNSDVILCPTRLWGNNHLPLRAVAQDAFGSGIPFYVRDEYESLLGKGIDPGRCIVARPEAQVNFVDSTSFVRIDWVLLLIDGGEAKDMAVVEFQSMDITDNYRATWRAYRDLKNGQPVATIPTGEHGINELNVQKRLSQQLIRKGNTVRKSKLCTKGMYFVVTDQAYNAFKKSLESLPTKSLPDNDTLSVVTFRLGAPTAKGTIRPLVQSRPTLRVGLLQFAQLMISEASAPPGESLDQTAQRVTTEMRKKYRPKQPRLF